jgi:Polyketide cyclase / dehydrase and lipid transport
MTGAQAEVTIDKPADEVWNLIGDFGNLSWIPNTKSLQLDDDIRTFQLGDSIVKHCLVGHDDTARSYTYALASDVAPDSGAVVQAIEATISVVPDGPSACTVTWTSETEERKGSSDTLGAFFQGILDHLKNQLEHA